MPKAAPQKRASSRSTLPPDRMRKQARASATVQKIIEAANTLLNTRGVVSNEAIAEQANVSISSIYRYFQNRADLLAAIFRIDADHTLGAITDAIAKMDSTNYMTHLKDIIEIAAHSVSGERAARNALYGSIGYDVANEINIDFNLQLQRKLTEQIALISNCHPRFVDDNLVVILARQLVTIPRLLFLENPETPDHKGIVTELTKASVGLFKEAVERAKLTHSNH